MKWHSIYLSQVDIAAGNYHRICREFQKAFIAAGAPEEMALYVQTIPDNGSRTLYFSPGSAPYVRDLVQSYEGELTECPERDDVTLLFGVSNACEKLLSVRDEKKPQINSENERGLRIVKINGQKPPKRTSAAF